MILKTKREKLVNEFCVNGNLEAYRDTLNKIFNDLEASSVKISARYDVDFSNFEDYGTSDQRRIRISLKNVVDPLDVLWVLFHEFGHFLSPKRKKGDDQVKREELAWQYADNTLKTYPELAAFSDSYEAYKKRCLNSYYRKYDLPLI